MRSCNHSSRVRHGFTLVELLVVISIIALMSGMFMVAYRGAALESSNQKTVSTLTKISEVLNSRMEEYSSYPVTYVMPIPSIATSFVPSETTTLLLERARLLSLRDIILTEMPDHPDDIKWTAGWMPGKDPMKTLPTGLGSPTTGYAYAKAVETSRAIRIKQRVSVMGPFGYVPIAGWETTNANAELLYLIVEDSSLNGTSAIELFGKSEIGDSDGDGLHEFLDAYRKPIQWIRWPAGFPGVAAYHPDLLDPNLSASNVASDPLDRMRADPGYSVNAPPAPPGNNLPKAGMFPLVVSPGPDGVFGYRFRLDSPNGGSYSVADCPAWNGFYVDSLNSNSFNLQFTDPWYPRSDESARLGAVINASAAEDDLTNYVGNGASL